MTWPRTAEKWWHVSGRCLTVFRDQGNSSFFSLSPLRSGQTRTQDNMETFTIHDMLINSTDIYRILCELAFRNMSECENASEPGTPPPMQEPKGKNTAHSLLVKSQFHAIIAFPLLLFIPKCGKRITHIHAPDHQNYAPTSIAHHRIAFTPVRLSNFRSVENYRTTSWSQTADPAQWKHSNEQIPKTDNWIKIKNICSKYSLLTNKVSAVIKQNLSYVFTLGVGFIVSLINEKIETFRVE